MALVLSRKIGPHTFHGATMLPFLVDGDEVSIEPVGFDDVRAGDVVTYRDQQYFPTRRVIRIDRRSRSLILKGDAIPELTFFVLEEDLLGRVTTITRGDRRFNASDAEWRATARSIVARERRRARTAWLPSWLGLGPDVARRRDAAASAALDSARGRGSTPGAPWWRTGRAAVDLDGLQVLRALLGGDPERAAWVLSRMKPRRFLDFTRENGIAGDLVVLARDAGGAVSAVFDPILGELLEAARGQRENNREVLRHLGEVSEVLDRAGLEFLVLKGPHLSLAYYGSLDQRRIGDLDLLVRRRDMRAAHRALIGAGYRPRSGAPLGMAATLRFVHHLELEKDGMPVDLHHRIRVHPTFRFDEAEWWRTAGWLDLGDRRVRVLSDDNVLVTLILSIHNDIGLGTADLHPFFDLDRVLGRVGAAVDWEAFFAARRRERTATIAVNVLALYCVLMGAGERHPRLLAALESRAGDLVAEPRRRACCELIQGATLAAKKRWAFEQFAAGLPAAALWWLVGLPVHALVYRRIFFRNFAERLALGRATRFGKAQPLGGAKRGRSAAGAGAPGEKTRPSTERAAAEVAEIDVALLPALAARPMRLGSLAVELLHDRPFAADVLEELFRLEGTRGDAAAVGAPDLRVRVFDATLDDVLRFVPPPIAPVVRRDLEGVVEIHHKAASAIVARPREREPRRRGPRGTVEVILPLRPSSAASLTRSDDAVSGEQGEHGASGPGAEATSPAEPAAASEALLVHSLMIVFYRTLLELDCLHLHAAAARLDGRTSLFLGGKGAGKSTLCLALGQAGATILGEDHVLVRRAGAGYVVSGCDANMRLTSKTETELLSAPPPDGRKAFFGGVLKREFDLRETTLDVRPFEDVPPDRIFFPRVGDRVAIERIPRAEAVVRILGSIHDRHAIATASDARRLLDYVGGLVDSLEAYDLQLSPDLADLGAVVDFAGGGSPRS